MVFFEFLCDELVFHWIVPLIRALRRPYFALPNVLDGLFGLCKRLFGVEIVAADGQAPVWHKVSDFAHVVLMTLELNVSLRFVSSP